MIEFSWQNVWEGLRQRLLSHLLFAYHGWGSSTPVLVCFIRKPEPEEGQTDTETRRSGLRTIIYVAYLAQFFENPGGQNRPPLTQSGRQCGDWNLNGRSHNVLKLGGAIRPPVRSPDFINSRGFPSAGQGGECISLALSWRQSHLGSPLPARASCPVWGSLSVIGPWTTIFTCLVCEWEPRFSVLIPHF